MNYTELVSLLQTVAMAAGGASFWTGTKAANVGNYLLPFPMVELFFSPSGLIGETVVQYSIGMGFYAKDTHENGSPDAVRLQGEMDILTQQFIRLLREEEDVEIVDRKPSPDVLRSPTIRNGTKVGTGFYIDFTLNVAALPC